MFALVGLGNPGPEYVFTRHNAGFLFLDHFCRRRGCLPWKHERLYAWTESDSILLIKPMTFMNASGIAFPHLMVNLGVSLDEILVVVDDVSLPLGRLRIRKKGSDGGHNGLKSIINALQTRDFNRMRIGIGPKPPEIGMVDFVLGEFSNGELEILYGVFDVALEAVEVIINDGVDKAMSLYNSIEVRR